MLGRAGVSVHLGFAPDDPAQPYFNFFTLVEGRVQYSHGKLQPGSRSTDSLSVVPGSLTYPCIGLQARAFATSASTSIAKDGHFTAGLRRRKDGELSALLDDVSLLVNIHRLVEQTRRILQSLF